MRSFVAIELDNKFRQEIFRQIRRVQESSSAIRWIPAENWHITLKFLGEITAEQKNSVTEQIQTVSLQTKSFPISVNECGYFPPERLPRVFWLGVGEGRKPLETLARDVEQAMVNLGFPSEMRPFQAHITAGRLRRGKRVAPQFLNQWQQIRFPVPIEMLVKQITIFQSTLRPEGPEYTALERLDFAADLR